MKIDITLMNDAGEPIAKALESDVRSLIINGMVVIREGEVMTNLTQLTQEQQADNLVQMFCPNAEVPVEIN